MVKTSQAMKMVYTCFLTELTELTEQTARHASLSKHQQSEYHYFNTQLSL